jgi:hypothetical protein
MDISNVGRWCRDILGMIVVQSGSPSGSFLVFSHDAGRTCSLPVAYSLGTAVEISSFLSGLLCRGYRGHYFARSTRSRADLQLV